MQTSSKRNRQSRRQTLKLAHMRARVGWPGRAQEASNDHPPVEAVSEWADQESSLPTVGESEREGVQNAMRSEHSLANIPLSMVSPTRGETVREIWRNCDTACVEGCEEGTSPLPPLRRGGEGTPGGRRFQNRFGRTVREEEMKTASSMGVRTWILALFLLGPNMGRSDQPQAGKEATAMEHRTRVLFVTGQEYHDWRSTTPVLVQILGQDPRFDVTVSEDPSILCSPEVLGYDVLFHHWMNWQVPAPGPEARENLKRFLEAGKGMVLIHFACGEFQDWPEYKDLVGRVWDPKMRPHDPHGAFEVQISDANHPITQGLSRFETTDELYTCLAGEAPIRVLATARSKVDGLDYPMAFTCEPGKGRVFQCLLGHDAQALKPVQVQEMLKRGTAWAAGILVESQGDGQKKIVMMAGPASHGFGCHEHKAGLLLLAQALNQAAPSLQVLVQDGWPADPGVLAGAAALVLDCDGGGAHVLAGHHPEVDALMANGVGLACLHYSLMIGDGSPGSPLLKWIGGAYETHWSVNPVWTGEFNAFPEHPITRGVRPFKIEDEWYFHMRFPEGMAGVTPVLTAVPPDSTREREDGPHSNNPTVRAGKGAPEHVAWCFERPDGGRGFGFTGGHWHWNWAHPGMRKLVLNAILWVAKEEVPQAGVVSHDVSSDDLLKNLAKAAPEGWTPDELKQTLAGWNAE